MTADDGRRTADGGRRTTDGDGGRRTVDGDEGRILIDIFLSVKNNHKSLIISRLHTDYFFHT